MCGTPEIQAVLEWERAGRHMTGMIRDVQCSLYEMRLNQLQPRKERTLGYGRSLQRDK